MEAELGAALELQHADVVDLADLGDAERGGGRALAQVALGGARLDVHDDVGVRQLAADRLLDLVGGRVRLGEARVGADRDDEVDEVAAGGVAGAQPADLEVAELGQRGADRLLGVGVRAVHQHLDRLAGQPGGGDEDERGDDQRRDRVRAAARPRRRGQADEDRERAREVRGEVQRVGRQRRRVVAAGGALRDDGARGVDADHDREHEERPPGRLDVGAGVSEASRSTAWNARNAETSMRKLLSASAARCSALPWP